MMENLLATKRKKPTKNQWNLSRREKLALLAEGRIGDPGWELRFSSPPEQDLEKGQAHTIPGRASGTGGRGGNDGQQDSKDGQLQDNLKVQPRAGRKAPPIGTLKGALTRRKFSS